jgi:DinB family protein
MRGGQDDRILAIFQPSLRPWLEAGRRNCNVARIRFVEFHLDTALPVLRRTPSVVRTLLADLPRDWIEPTEGPGTWSPFDVVGHLIHGERTDWMPRVDHIFHHGDAIPFPPFDREAMFRASEGQSLDDLLDTFASLRRDSVDRLGALRLTDGDLDRHGRHPEFGIVTLRQHLATWVAHDLGHISQIVRVMARQYSDAVGPWRAYLSILSRPGK